MNVIELRSQHLLRHMVGAFLLGRSNYQPRPQANKSRVQLSLLQNNALETQVEQLMDANTKLGEDMIAIQQQNAELLETIVNLSDTVDNLAMTLKEAKTCYHDEVQENERLKLEAEDIERQQADMKASVARMTEDHASTIGSW